MKENSCTNVSNNLVTNLRENISLLSKREYEVLIFIAEGLENKAIAKRLFISVKTVEFHKENIKQKLGIKTIKELYEYNFMNIF